tara:strand:+ start:641 stop:805 length:165 start_codon:yes stop_codon:yes gene_type:complete
MKKKRFKYRRETMPKREKTIIVRRCNICQKNKPVWSNKNGIFCKECHKKRSEEE